MLYKQNVVEFFFNAGLELEKLSNHTSKAAQNPPQLKRSISPPDIVKTNSTWIDMKLEA